MKDPAFLFYPNDWIGGTMGMTFEEKGAYMELLMLQFNRGHMTSHMIGHTVGQLWDKVKDKFEIDMNGNFFNQRLDLEKLKRKEFSKSRRNNLSGKNQFSNKENNSYKMPGHKGAHMTSHMEDENIDLINDNKLVIYTNSIVGDMLKSFKNLNPNYPGDRDKDFSACFQIALKIGKSKGWEQNEIITTKREDVVLEWENIIDFIVSDKWFSTRSLFDINNEWQRIIQSINSIKGVKQRKKLSI